MTPLPARVGRKYKDPWTGRLEVRFMLLTNELPRFTDASGALAKRFVVLVLSKTFAVFQERRTCV